MEDGEVWYPSHRGCMMEKIRVLLADDKEVFREGLARLLEEEKSFKVVSQCVGGKQAIEQVREMKPDVVLIDNNISDCDSSEAVREIKGGSPEVRIAMLTDCENEEELFTAIESGATGYLLKDTKIAELVKSIELIGNGEVVVSPPLSEKLTGKFASLRKAEAGSGPAGLTTREVEVVRLLAQGATNKEIAKRLFIAQNTVKVHLKNILEKLQLRNRQQLVAYAVQEGLVPKIIDTTEIIEVKEKPK
jgi:DNA-binding NarL/FixJ family response regulator